MSVFSRFTLRRRGVGSLGLLQALGRLLSEARAVLKCGSRSIQDPRRPSSHTLHGRVLNHVTAKKHGRLLQSLRRPLVHICLPLKRSRRLQFPLRPLLGGVPAS
jgi:hypothetical protein